jgi:hypothetical protein
VESSAGTDIESSGEAIAAGKVAKQARSGPHAAAKAAMISHSSLAKIRSGGVTSVSPFLEFSELIRLSVRL